MLLQTLSDPSVEQYNEEGYTGPLRVFAPMNPQALRRKFFETIGQDEEAAPAPTSTYMSAWHHQHKWAYEMATDPRILDAVSRCSDPTSCSGRCHFWYKVAAHRPAQFPWHQDAAYWHITPKKNVTAWLALGPTFLENGCACGSFSRRIASRR